MKNPLSRHFLFLRMKTRIVFSCPEGGEKKKAKFRKALVIQQIAQASLHFWECGF